MNVVGSKTNSNPEHLNGKVKDIKRKPHAIYVAFIAYLPVKLQCSTLTGTWKIVS
jgi:hypothetical protein